MEVDESCALDRLARDRVQKAEAHAKALEQHVETSDSKYSITVEKVVQVEEELRTSVTSSVSEFKTDKDCIARFAKDLTDEHREE